MNGNMHFASKKALNISTTQTKNVAVSTKYDIFKPLTPEYIILSHKEKFLQSADQHK